MSKTDNTVLKDMIIIMLLYGIIAQIVCLIIPRGSSENDSRALDRGGCRCFHGNPYEKLVG